MAQDPQILNPDNPGPSGLSRVLSAQRQGYRGAQTTHFSLFWVRVDFRESRKADRCSATNWSKNWSWSSLFVNSLMYSWIRATPLSAVSLITDNARAFLTSSWKELLFCHVEGSVSRISRSRPNFMNDSLFLVETKDDSVFDSNSFRFGCGLYTDSSWQSSFSASIIFIFFEGWTL